jgi:[ribosomal protein S5]-alanine N-acetyltransferase
VTGIASGKETAADPSSIATQPAPTSAEERSANAAAVTARLRVEPLRAAHAPLLLPVLAERRIYAYIPDVSDPTLASLTKRYALLERGAPSEAKEVWLNWALQRMDTDAYVGTLQATVVPGSHAHIGYVLGEPAWGQGFATEACRWLVATLQARFEIDQIMATVDVRNVRSARVLERLGFECVGTEAAELRGETTTDYRYRLACAPRA